MARPSPVDNPIINGGTNHNQEGECTGRPALEPGPHTERAHGAEMSALALALCRSDRLTRQCPDT